LGHAQQSICREHVSLASLFYSILSRTHHAGNARDASKVHVPWPWPMCSTAPLKTPNMIKLSNITNAHMTSSERASCLDSSSKHRHFIWFLLPAHRWSGVSDVLREFFLVYIGYFWCSSAFVWRLLFRKFERVSCPGFRPMLEDHRLFGGSLLRVKATCKFLKTGLPFRPHTRRRKGVGSPILDAADQVLVRVPCENCKAGGLLAPLAPSLLFANCISLRKAVISGPTSASV
jgi:hypothetical protein